MMRAETTQRFMTLFFTIRAETISPSIRFMRPTTKLMLIVPIGTRTLTGVDGASRTS